MNRYDLYKDIAESLKPIKNCVAIFEAHIENVIEELESGVMYSPEAANDPDNLTRRPSPIRRMFASERLHQDCLTYSNNRKGTIDGDLMRVLLETYLESTKVSDKRELDDVIKYAREKGFRVSAGTDGKGENVILLYQK